MQLSAGKKGWIFSFSHFKNIEYFTGDRMICFISISHQFSYCLSKLLLVKLHGSSQFSPNRRIWSHYPEPGLVGILDLIIMTCPFFLITITASMINGNK